MFAHIRLQLRIGSKRRLLGWVLGAACLLFFLLDICFPVPAHIAFAPAVLSKDSAVLYAFLTPDEQWRMRAELHEISPELQRAIVFKEDKYFWSHPGINPLALGRAIGYNILQRRRTSGASTITMQVARMLEPKRRSYGAKLIEMFRALQLEWHYSKAEILQLYLNLVPYGSNIQGVKAAAWLYFDKNPDQLSLAEITALSIIPNKPNRLVIGRDNQRIVLERNKWLTRFQDAHLFAQETIRDALAEPLNAHRHAAPRRAAQFAWRMRHIHPGYASIHSTIDRRLQQSAEDLASSYMEGLKLQGIHNAAVIVIENHNRAVRAYVGSSDFFDSLHHGQVDGVTAHRSPGSALKPLLYAMAIDRGLITPRTVLYDVPTQIGMYAPENYDLTFRGSVPAAEALQQSLNIPAVRLLDQISVGSFVNKLSEAGFRQVWKERRKMGLSVILGGCGVSLEELAALYATFANEGVFEPLRYESSSTLHGGQGARLISKESNYLLSEILRSLHRPDLPSLFDQAQGLPKVAWKTGTSYGRRDAWSVGFNRRFTIGVWVGNFDGKGVAGLNGAASATPLLFRLFRAIDREADTDWLLQSGDLSMRQVCPVTGKPAGIDCTDTLSDYYIPGVSSNEACTHLKEYCLTMDGKFAYCTSCLPTTGFIRRQLPSLPSELTSYYEQFHIPYPKIPPHNPYCQRLFDGSGPVITSLANGGSYIIVDKGKQQLQLGCTASNDVREVYWYINDRFYASGSASKKLFFDPEDTDIRITCTDDKGRNARIRIKVTFL